ncbi:adenylyltransferase/cytidyltransferase family protein, partial [Planctomycetaceae bacterium]|nr:adenylyltransferase/cytidyltransferase family protein [Planctomycetaceae bacterium]
MRLGILGGSFDPVHLGHLVMAEVCREQLNLDEV